MKSYVVNTPNEKHFFTSKKEALNDFTAGKRAMRKIKDYGTISLIAVDKLTGLEETIKKETILKN